MTCAIGKKGSLAPLAAVCVSVVVSSLHVTEDAREGFPEILHRVVSVFVGDARLGAQRGLTVRHGRTTGWSGTAF